MDDNMILRHHVTTAEAVARRHPPASTPASPYYAAAMPGLGADQVTPSLPFVGNIDGRRALYWCAGPGGRRARRCRRGRVVGTWTGLRGADLVVYEDVIERLEAVCGRIRLEVLTNGFTATNLAKDEPSGMRGYVRLLDHRPPYRKPLGHS